MQIDFSGAAEFIDSAAKIVKTLTESIADSVKAGAATIDLLSVRKSASRLADIHKRGVHLVVQQGIFIVPTAEKYLKMPNESNWSEVKESIRKTLTDVEALASELNVLRGDFVLEETYAGLLRTMKQREQALQKVLALPHPPSSPEELDSFRAFLEKYIILIRELQQMGFKVGNYIREQEKEKPKS